jgi:hypothetical protein
MRNIITYLIVIFAVYSCKSQNNNLIFIKAKSEIYGEWIVKELLQKQYSKYTNNQLSEIKNSLLIVDANKIYFKGLNYIDSCSFVDANIKVNYLLDENNFEYSWYKEGNELLVLPKMAGPIIYRYSKNQLNNMIRLELGCGYDLSILFLNNNELIVNYLNGITLILEKKIEN